MVADVEAPEQKHLDGRAVLTEEWNVDRQAWKCRLNPEVRDRYTGEVSESKS